MQGHRGLPKNIPQRQNKARIFSPGVSPVKNQSPQANNSSYKQSLNRTPQRQSQLSQSKHRLKSKQKPSLNDGRQKSKQSKNHKLTITKKVNNQNQYENSKKPVRTQFVQTVLGIMGKFGKNQRTQPQPQPLYSKIQQDSSDKFNNNQQQRQSRDFQSEVRRFSIQSYDKQTASFNQPQQNNQKSKAYQYTDEQLLERCAQQLQNQENHLNYCGGLSHGLRTGYGIQHFTNNDKFMGGFSQNKAEGHGTYYCKNIGKKILAIWSRNQIVLNSGYLIQKI